MTNSFSSSPNGLVFYLSAAIIVIGGLFTGAVIGGREWKEQFWLHEKAIVLNTYSLCRMVYGDPSQKGRPRYVDTVPCEDAGSYIEQHKAEYDYLRPDEVEYVSLGYASLGADIKTVKRRDISQYQSLSTGQRLDILVHPRTPQRIDRPSTTGEYGRYMAQLLVSSVLVVLFLMVWVYPFLGEAL